MGKYIGDFIEDTSAVTLFFETIDALGGSITYTSGTLKAERSDGTAITAGLTLSKDDPDTGLHRVTVDTSAHADYATGYDYLVWDDGATIDGQTVNIFIGSFSIENRTVDVDRLGESTTALANLVSACANYSATRGLSGTALPNAAADAAGGLPISDAGGLDMDALLDQRTIVWVDSTDGDDSNDGYSRTNAKKTLLAALKILEDRQTLYLTTNSYKDEDWGVSIVNASYKWTPSGNEYYLEAAAGGDPGLGDNSNLLIDGSKATEGTAGTLAEGEWDYGDNDSLGYDTFYVRLTGNADPDSKADDYIRTGWLEIENRNVHVIFDQAEIQDTGAVRGGGQPVLLISGRWVHIETRGTGWVQSTSNPCLKSTNAHAKIDGPFFLSTGGTGDNGVALEATHSWLEGDKIYANPYITAAPDTRGTYGFKLSGNSCTIRNSIVWGVATVGYYSEGAFNTADNLKLLDVGADTDDKIGVHLASGAEHNAITGLVVSGRNGQSNTPIQIDSGANNNVISGVARDSELEGSSITDSGNNNRVYLETQTESEAALQTYNLDHLLSAACPSNTLTNAVVDYSVVAFLAAVGADISDYSATTESLEALRDHGDSQWSGGGISTTTTVGETTTTGLTAYQHAVLGPFAFTASKAQTGDSHAFIVYKPETPGTVEWQLDTAGGDITISGDSDEIVTVEDAGGDENTGTAGTWCYILRNTTDDTVIADGTLTIEARPDVST